MKAVKAIYENGKIKLLERPAADGPMEVLVVFPEPADDPWHAILDETPPRRSFLTFMEQCEEEIRKGNSKPLELDEL